MSAGAFTISRYAANDGTIAPIKVQPETLAATIGGTANVAPTGTNTLGRGVAKISRAKNGYGLRPRLITFRFTAAPPAGYLLNATYRLPVLVAATWNSASIGTVVNYLGVAGIVTSRLPELDK